MGTVLSALAKFGPHCWCLRQLCSIPPPPAMLQSKPSHMAPSEMGYFICLLLATAAMVHASGSPWTVEWSDRTARMAHGML